MEMKLCILAGNEVVYVSMNFITLKRGLDAQICESRFLPVRSLFGYQIEQAAGTIFLPEKVSQND